MKTMEVSRIETVAGLAGNGIKEGAMQKKDESHIEFAIHEALDAAADRCEQYGGDIRELQKVRDTAPNTMETVAKIEALYRPKKWWWPF